MIDRYRLEFNPNKVSDNEVFKIIHKLLIKYCRKSLNHIARFDLAIDIPVDRSRCFLVKDRRLYIERKHGVEYTQYLGSKSASVGRVKLYNKTAEAKLDYPLTRLELTLDPETPYEKINFPTTEYFKKRSECRAENAAHFRTDKGGHIDGKGAGGGFADGNEIDQIRFGYPLVLQHLLLDKGEHGVAAAKGEQTDLEKGEKQRENAFCLAVHCHHSFRMGVV